MNSVRVAGGKRKLGGNGFQVAPASQRHYSTLMLANALCHTLKGVFLSYFPTKTMDGICTKPRHRDQRKGILKSYKMAQSTVQ